MLGAYIVFPALRDSSGFWHLGRGQVWVQHSCDVFSPRVTGYYQTANEREVSEIPPQSPRQASELVTSQALH